jgi:hypothetical protein
VKLTGAADLAAASDRPAVIHAENLSVAAAFGLSYRDLTEDQQRLFRRLGLVPGPSFDAYAAAALDGTSLDRARRLLDDLYDQHLLTEPAPGRYRMHDLIRAHTRALAGRLDTDGDREQATARLLDYYQHTAARADALLARQARASPAPVGPAGPATVPPSLIASRLWPGSGPSAPTCSAAWTTPPEPARMPASSPSPRVWPACCATTARGPRPSPAIPLPCALRSTSATGPVRPAPSLTWGMRGG